MDLNCAVTSDLLLMYSEDLCSEETKALVEAHLAGCEECRKKYQRMMADTIPEPFVPEEKHEAVIRPLNAKKVLKRIRRRWIAVVMCILLFIPISFLSYNEAKGAGLSFTTIPYAISSHAFVTALTNGDYEKAFSQMDIKGVYAEYADAEYTDFSEYSLAKDFQEVEIGGESYYIKKSVYENEYAEYLNSGDEIHFWYDLFSYYESTYDLALMIPEDMIVEISDMISMNGEMASYFLEFVPVETAGGIYYMPEGVSEWLETGATGEFAVIPAADYNLAVEELKQRIEGANEYTAKYIEMGFENYYEQSHTIFIKNLESIENKEIQITDFRMTDIYRMNADKWHITYAVSMIIDNEPVTGMTLEMITSKDGMTSCTLQGNYKFDEKYYLIMAMCYYLEE